MKRLFPILALATIALGAVGQTHVQFVLTDPLWSTTYTTNRNILVWTEVITAHGGGYGVASRRKYTTDTNSQVTLSNIVNGLYGFEVQAPPATTRGMFLVTEAESGTVNVTNILAASAQSTYPSGSVAWSATASDGRYAPAGSVGITNASDLAGALLADTNLFIAGDLVSTGAATFKTNFVVGQGNSSTGTFNLGSGSFRVSAGSVRLGGSVTLSNSVAIPGVSTQPSQGIRYTLLSVDTNSANAGDIYRAPFITALADTVNSIDIDGNATARAFTGDGNAVSNLHGWLSTRDFGSVPGADATLAIQSAINRATNTVGSSSTVRIPPGVYTITNTLRLHRGVKLEGAGFLDLGFSTNAVGLATVLRFTATDRDAILVSDVTGNEIRRIHLWGPTNTAWSGIAVSNGITSPNSATFNGENIVVENCIVSQFGVGLNIVGPTLVTVRGSRIEYNRDTAIRLSGYTDSMRIEQCRLGYGTNAATTPTDIGYPIIYQTAGAELKSLHISDCEIGNCYPFMDINGPAEGIVVDNCNFERLGTAAGHVGTNQINLRSVACLDFKNNRVIDTSYTNAFIKGWGSFSRTIRTMGMRLQTANHTGPAPYGATTGKLLVEEEYAYPNVISDVRDGLCRVVYSGAYYVYFGPHTPMAQAYFDQQLPSLQTRGRLMSVLNQHDNHGSLTDPDRLAFDGYRGSSTLARHYLAVTSNQTHEGWHNFTGPVNGAHDVLDVRYFGAVAGGSASANRTAIQAALNVATGKVVFLPVGTFQIDAALQIAFAGTTIRGSGMERTVLETTSTTQAAITNAIQTWYGTIENMTIRKASRDSTSMTAGIAQKRWDGSLYQPTGSRGVYRNLKVHNFHKGFDIRVATGNTFINVEAYQNVHGFYCPKIDAATWIGCYAGDANGASGATDFGAFQEESTGWFFDTVPTWLNTFGVTLLNCESRYTATNVYARYGHLTVVGMNIEQVRSNAFYIGPSINAATLENCRVNSATGREFVVIGAGAANKVSIINPEMSSPGGFNTVKINESGTAVPFLSGNSVTLTNENGSGASYTLTATTVAAGTGASVSRQGNAWTVSVNGAAAGLKNGLVAWYDFEESGGNSLLDSSTNHLHLFRSNSIATANATSPINGRYLVVDHNVNHFAVHPASPSVDVDGDWTISVWVRYRTNTPASDQITPMVSVGDYDAAPISIGVAFPGPSINRWRAYQGTNYAHHAATSVSSEINSWRHLVAKWDGSTLSLIRQNGTADTATVVDPVDLRGAQGILIGASVSSGAACDIDSVGIWNRALTSGEITTLYNSGTALDYGDL